MVDYLLKQKEGSSHDAKVRIAMKCLYANETHKLEVHVEVEWMP